LPRGQVARRRQPFGFAIAVSLVFAAVESLMAKNV
jgi:hypothetical protein